MKSLLSITTMMLLGLSCMAQTSRKFTVNITPDGKSNMQVFLPEHASGRVIVDCPGGGYTHLSMQNEGTDWVTFFNKQGIAYCVLTYRMPKGDRMVPMSDAMNAIRMVRDSASVWNVNANDVGIMGFSAGGHLASTIATHAQIEVRPNFQILFYPVISMNERVTHKGSVVGFLGDKRNDKDLVEEFSNDKQVRRHVTPPAFLVMASDDRAVPPLTNGLPYYVALRKAGVPAALHIYPTGSHGFGFRSNFAYHDQLLDELSAWLKQLPAPKADAQRVACIGNSITDGMGIDMSDVEGYPAQLQRMLGTGYFVKNFGVSGRTMLRNADRPYVNETAWTEAKAFNPNVVVLKLGTNDSKPVNWNSCGKAFRADLQQMIDDLKQLPSRPRIIVCCPIRTVKFNGNPRSLSDSVLVNEIIPVIKRVAKKNKLELLDLYATLDNEKGLLQRDGIHPTSKGAGVLAKVIGDVIMADGSPKEKK